MAGKYYAKFHVKHEDKSDSYLRKAYINMDLHTDGTYVKEKTDWLLMTKLDEKNVEGGETTMLHLDDWEHCEDLFNDPTGSLIVILYLLSSSASDSLCKKFHCFIFFGSGN